MAGKAFKIAVVGMLISFTAQYAGAHGLDEPSQKSLEETKQMLRDPQKRQKAIGNDEMAKDAHNKAELLGGSPENTEMIYDLAAEVMDQITKESGGDPQKMIELLEKARRNPKGFASSLSPENKRKLRETAAKIESSKTQSPGTR